MNFEREEELIEELQSLQMNGGNRAKELEATTSDNKSGRTKVITGCLV